MIFFRFSKNRVSVSSWSTLLWYQCYYPHWLRDALSPVCGTFSLSPTNKTFTVLVLKKLNNETKIANYGLHYFEMYPNAFFLFLPLPSSDQLFWKGTRNLFPAPAPDCLCPAGPTPWSVTLILNRNSSNIMPLCKVMFPSSIQSLLCATPVTPGLRTIDLGL